MVRFAIGQQKINEKLQIGFPLVWFSNDHNGFDTRERLLNITFGLKDNVIYLEMKSWYSRT